METMYQFYFFLTLVTCSSVGAPVAADPSENIPLPQCGVLHGTCVHGNSNGYLFWIPLHGLQGNICSPAWSTFFLPLILGSMLLFLPLYSLLLSPPDVFCPFFGISSADLTVQYGTAPGVPSQRPPLKPTSCQRLSTDANCACHAEHCVRLD